MHWIHLAAFHLVADPSTAPDPTSGGGGGGGGHDALYTTLVIVLGGIITTAMTLIAKSIGSKKVPAAPLESGDSQQERWTREGEARERDRYERERINARAQDEASEQSAFVRNVLAAVTQDRDELEAKLTEARELYRLLREGVLRKGLKPDELIEEARI